MPLYSLVSSFRPLLAPVPRLRFRTDTHTDRHTQDNYRNPPAHARRGVLTVDYSQRSRYRFSANLMWGPHFKLILSRAYKVLGLLRRVFSTIQCAQSKRILYLTLVRPHLLYCSSLWHPHLLSDIRSLETMQRRATKFIICDSSLDYKERLINSNLLPLMMEFEIRDILFFLSVLKQIMHTLIYMTFLLLAALKPAHPPSLNFVIPNPTTIEYPDCGTLYL